MAKYALVVVEGDSMEPTYRAGDWLMGRWADYKLGGWNRVRVGDVVVIERDEQPGIYYVKTVSQIQGSEIERSEIFLLSDNDAGTDSRQWGWLPVAFVRAKILFRMKRA